MHRTDTEMNYYKLLFHRLTHVLTPVQQFKAVFLCARYEVFAIVILNSAWFYMGECGDAVGWRTVLQTGRLRFRFPDGVIGIFHWHDTFGHIMTLGSTQSLTEISTRNISERGKGGRYVGLTTLPPSCNDCLEIYDLQPPGALRSCSQTALPSLLLRDLVHTDGLSRHNFFCFLSVLPWVEKNI